MRLALFPPAEGAPAFLDMAVKAAWWLSAAPGDGGAGTILIPRIAPTVDLARLDPPASVDERIALRLARLPAEVVPVVSVEAFARQLVGLAEGGFGIVVLDRHRLPQDIADALRARGALFDADPRQNEADAIAFLAAAARLGTGADGASDSAAAKRIKRATARAERVVVAGPDLSNADLARLRGEVLALDPMLAGRWSGEGVAIFALDDPVRHLGPSRTAALLRDLVIAKAESHRDAFLAGPRAAGRLLRSRVPRSLWERLVLVDVAPRLDPGPATLIAAAAGLVDVVDVIGYGGRPRPLAPDEAAMHPAAAARRDGAADLTDVVAAAEAVGVRIAALGRTAHRGLASRDRGRAPTAVDGPADLLGDAADRRFSPAGARKLTVRRTVVDGRPAVVVSRGDAEGDVIATFSTDGRTGAPWPPGAEARADVLLDAADVAMPGLVLTPPRSRETLAGAPALTAAGIRARLAGLRGPDGPFASEADEIAALLAYRRLVERDLDRIHVPRFSQLAETFEGRVFLLGTAFDPATVNARRLAGEVVALVDRRLADIPAPVRDAARAILLITTRPALRHGDDAGPPHLVRVTTLAAGHRAAPTDVVVDPAAYLPPGAPEDPDTVAVQLLRALGAAPIVALGLPTGSGAGSSREVVRLADHRREGAEAATFHDLFRRDDFAAAPRVLLAIPQGADIALFERLLAGMGDRLTTAVTDGRLVRVIAGERIAEGLRGVSPAYVAEDPELRRVLARAKPGVVLLADGARHLALPPAPVITVGSVRSDKGLPDILLPEASGARREAMLDAARLALADAFSLPLPSLDAATDAAMKRPRDRRLRAAESNAAAAPARSRPARAAPLRPAGLAVAAVALRGVVGGVRQAGAVARRPRSGRSTGDGPKALFVRRPPSKSGVVAVARPSAGEGDAHMADSRLTSDAAARSDGLASLWPFPGILLLLVFAVWLVYMGSIAGMEDVATAFYGLGGVTALLLVLAFRAMAAGRVRRRHAAPPVTRRRRRHAGRGGATGHPVGNDPMGVPRRSAIVDEGAAPVEGAIYPGVTAGAGMPLNARMRARQDEFRTAAMAEDEDNAYETRRSPRRGEPTDAAFEPTDATTGDNAGRPAARPPLQAEPMPPRDGPHIGDTPATLRQLEVRVNRERAERGAQIAKLEALLKSEMETLRDALRGRPEASSEGGGEADVAQLNSAAKGQLLQRIGEMIDKRVAEAMDPATLREALGGGAGAASTGDAAVDSPLGERIAAAHAAIANANEAAAAEREAIRAELEKLQRQVQRALRDSMNARRTVGDLGEGNSTVAEQLGKLQAAFGGAGGPDAPSAAPDLIEGRLADVVREVEELRGNLGAVTQHVARMGEHYQDLLARLDRLGGHISKDGRPAAAGAAGVQGEVDALREALTTIIEQNREIRAQQDRLSSRLETPRNSES